MTVRKTAAIGLGVLAVLSMMRPAHTQVARIAGMTPGPVGDGSARRAGRMDPSQPLRLTLVLQPPNQDELQMFLREVQDAASPRFHQFLTFTEWKARYAPPDSDVARVDAWAHRSGLRTIHRFRNNLAVKIEADAGAIERAFNVQLHHYELGSRRFFSNDRDPQMPTELLGLLKNVHGLNSYRRVGSANGEPPSDDEPVYRPGPFIREESAHASGRGRGHASGGTEAAEVGTEGAATAAPQICCGSGAIDPPDLFTSEAYGLAAFQRFSQCCNPTHDPNGSPRESSIAIIGHNAVALSDFQTFTAQYGLASNLTQVVINGAPCCNGEMTLDVEYATAFANSFGSYLDTAHVYAYEGDGAELSDLLDAWEQADSADKARSASSSFGAFEDHYGGLDPGISDFSDIINSMAAKGWTIAVASGDHGATDDCKVLSVNFPASSPYVVAAGGTILTLTNNSGAGKFSSEAAWNGPGCGGTTWPGQNLGGGGGGCADVESPGYWQAFLPNLCGGDKRALPDVALNASTGQRIFYAGGWISGGGTSIVAPELAGFFAQVNSYLLGLGNVCGSFPYDKPCAPLGHANPMIWAIGLSGAPNGHKPFYDITTGCNGGQGNAGYCATTGYDLATGWGSFNMLQLGWGLMSMVTKGTSPEITLKGPAVNTWYNSDRHVDFTVVADSPFGTNASVKAAGYTAQWDTAVADVVSHATPGTGDSFYTGPAKIGSADFLSLVAAGVGCHTAHARGWDNSGRTTPDGTYGPICYDNQPPNVFCASSPVGWQAIDASIECLASDQTNLSGLVNAADGHFTLTTNVAPGTETSNAFTDSRSVCDVATNCAPAGPIGGLKVDKKPPSITITVPAATQYIVNQSASADYSCADGGSGIATCSGPVASGSAIDTASVGTKTFTVNAADQVENGATRSATYDVTYKVCLQYDPSQPVNGRAVNIMVQICDYNNANVSQQSIIVTALAVDGQPGKATPLGNLNPGNRFLYGPGTSPGASYLYVLDAQRLGAGTRVLTFSVAGDPITHSAPFTLKK